MNMDSIVMIKKGGFEVTSYEFDEAYLKQGFGIFKNGKNANIDDFTAIPIRVGPMENVVLKGDCVLFCENSIDDVRNNIRNRSLEYRKFLFIKAIDSNRKKESSF